STAMNAKKLRNKWLGTGVGKYICIKCHMPIANVVEAYNVLQDFRNAHALSHIELQCQPKQHSIFQNLEYLDSIVVINDKFSDYNEFYELQEDRGKIILIMNDQHSQNT
ncbi:hypothetical protein ACSTHO_23530, partial [Vibrio parahaemolyticus]